VGTFMRMGKGLKGSRGFGSSIKGERA
ncbi:MAG: thioesterase, partial [Pseudomonadales bacterium]